LADHIDFTSQQKNQLCVQVPLVINNQELNTTLYVNKDGSANSGKGKNKNGGTALVALDTTSLGHFETYIQRAAQSVSCQFRLESEQIAHLVRKNIHKLTGLLNQYNYKLDSFTFLIGEEPFAITKSLKELEAENENSEKIQRPETIFDVQA
jgi:hypothetical protein